MRSAEVMMRKIYQETRGREGRHGKSFEGAMAEFKLLGECPDQSCEYMNWKDALYFARKNQPKNLPEFAIDLKDSIDYHFYPKELEGTDKVRVFTAVKTPLDIHHGTDGFVEVEKNGRTVTVSFDLTMNPEKHHTKADVLIHIPEEGINKKMDRGQFMNTVNYAADIIIKKAEEKLKKSKLTIAKNKKRYYKK